MKNTISLRDVCDISLDSLQMNQGTPIETWERWNLVADSVRVVPKGDSIRFSLQEQHTHHETHEFIITQRHNSHLIRSDYFDEPQEMYELEVYVAVDAAILCFESDYLCMYLCVMWE